MTRGITDDGVDITAAAHGCAMQLHPVDLGFYCYVADADWCVERGAAEVSESFPGAAWRPCAPLSEALAIGNASSPTVTLATAIERTPGLETFALAANTTRLWQSLGVGRNVDANPQARSIHWSPYDPVGVVNADP